MINGFIARNWKLKLFGHPIEDAFAIANDEKNDRKIAVVADGVTRDPMRFLPDLGTVRGKFKFLWKYSDESPAADAAKLFCRAVVRDAQDEFYSFGNNKVSRLMKDANFLIGAQNGFHIPKPDFVTRDLGGCVAAVAAFDKNGLHWGYICDSGVAVLDKKGNLRFKTTNDGPSKHDKYIWQSDLLKGRTWREPEARQIIRTHFRNNPQEPHSFGVFTGEEAAMHYVHTGTAEYKSKDMALIYTDGVEGIIFGSDGDINGKAADKIRARDWNGLKQLCKKNVRTEGTLVYSVGD